MVNNNGAGSGIGRWSRWSNWRQGVGGHRGSDSHGSIGGEDRDRRSVTLKDDFFIDRISETITTTSMVGESGRSICGSTGAVGWCSGSIATSPKTSSTWMSMLVTSSGLSHGWSRGSEVVQR